MTIIVGIPPEIRKDQPVALDVETFGQPQYKVHRPTGTFACLSVAVGDDVYQMYDSHDVPKALAAVKKGLWIFHNATYDLTQLRRFAVIKPRYVWDTQLVERSMMGGYYDEFTLAALTRRYLKERMGKEVRKEFETTTEMTPEMKEYAAKDALYTLRIAAIQRELFEGKDGFGAYVRIDEPLIFPMLDMSPIKVDVPAWRKFVEELAVEAEKAESALGVNTYSRPQVMAEARRHGIYLSDTQATTLQQYAGNPFIAEVLRIRGLRKAVSTYGLKWLEHHVEEGDLVYPSYHITGAETGRMSCSDPNLQNIPQRKMPVYRTLFISKFGRMVVSDISQQEPCILAFESRDEALLDAVRKGEDLHQTVADAIGRSRDVGKVINLATSYGMTEFGLSKKLGISEDEARGILKKYFQRFSGVFSWISQQRRTAHMKGLVSTASGRRVYINPYNRHWENNAINAPIQGGAADFTKMWIRKMWEKSGTENGLPFFLVGCVHDEVLLDPPKELLKDVRKLEEEAFLETADELFHGVPFRQETKSGRTWACKSMKEEVEDEPEE